MGPRTTHGMSKTKVYRTWKAISTRCKNKKNKEYKRYGARGIKICKRWIKFENFLMDMGIPPSGRNFSIERLNNRLGYSPKNWRWATAKEQARNRRTNRVLKINGVKKSMAEWAELYNISPDTIWARLSYGWTHSDAVLAPLRSARLCKNKIT